LAPLSPCGPSLTLGVELPLDAFFFRRGTNGSNPFPSAGESISRVPIVAAGANAATDQGLFHADGRASMGMPPRRSASAAPPRWHVGFSRSDRRNSTCDVYNVRSSCLAGARQSRSAMPPKCSWKPHCKMSVFVLLVFCLIGHPGRMPGSGRRRNDEPGRVSFEWSGSCCPLARRSSQMGTGQGSLLAWQPARRQ